MKTELIEDYKPILAQCYATDSDLIEKYHQVAGSGLQACIDKEFSDLQEVKTKVFKVTQDNALVGYFGKELYQGQECLTGFFLMPEFRTSICRSEFWNCIHTEFNKPFYCGLYEKNIPAVRFIQSRGGTSIKRTVLTDGPANLFKVGL